MTLLHRLAHRLLGWEYVEFAIPRRRERVRCYVEQRLGSNGHLWWRAEFQTGYERLHRDGTSACVSADGSSELTFNFDRALTWRPLTPGVAEFYRGTEK